MVLFFRSLNVYKPVEASSDSVVESRLSLAAAFRGCFRVLSLAFCDKLALLRDDLQLTVDGVVVLGNGRGKSPRRTLIAEAAAEAGYSPNKPGFCLLINGFKGGFPSSELLGPEAEEVAKVWYLEDTDDLGAEHSEGAVDGGVDVGVIMAAQGSRPRL